MPYIVVIDKMGAVKETNIKEYKESDLFKKAGFKSAEGFVLQHIWKDSAPNSSPVRGEIAIYAKKNGKAGQENKYEFPPPIDSVLFFGSCVLVKRQNGAVVDFRLTEWNLIYNNLMGGFEDLGSADDEDDDDAEGDTEEEELLANGAKLGKEGYILDDFIVEDERDEEDYDAFSESSKSEKEIEKKKKKKTVKKPSEKDKVSSKKKEKNTNIIVAPLVEERKEEMYLDCEMELVEEAYV